MNDVDTLLEAFAEDAPVFDEERRLDALLARLDAESAGSAPVPAAPARPAPRGRPWHPMLVAAAALVALGGAFGLGRLTAQRAPGIVVVEGPEPRTVEIVQAPPQRLPDRAASTREAPPITPVAGLGPGLTVFAASRVERAGGAVVLAEGALRFERNAELDPGVDRVRFAASGLVARPIGTTFVAVTTGRFDGLAVLEGRVILESPSGQALAEVRPGEAVLAAGQGATRRVERVDSGSVRELVARFPEQDGAALADFIVSLRLSALSDGQRSALDSLEPVTPEGGTR